MMKRKLTKDGVSLRMVQKDSFTWFKKPVLKLRNRRKTFLVENNLTAEYEMIKCPDLWNTWTNTIFFAAQVVTTVGYGNQYPKTEGRVQKLATS